MKSCWAVSTIFSSSCQWPMTHHAALESSTVLHCRSKLLEEWIDTLLRIFFPCLFRFANKKVLVVLYGVLSFVFASAGSYFNGTITTLEKRYKIPSKNMGIISVGNDVSSLFLSAFIAYYGGKSHRPRWIGIGLFMIALYCIITALPHFIYGSGQQALLLTVEHGGIKDSNLTENVSEMDNRKLLCRTNGD